MKLHDALVLVDSERKYIKTKNGHLKVYRRGYGLCYQVEHNGATTWHYFTVLVHDILNEDWEVGEDQ